MPLRLYQKSEGFEADFEKFLGSKRDIEEDVDSIAAEIIDNVRCDGDRAVAAYTKKFDRLSLDPSEFSVDADQLDAAIAQCDRKTIAALETAAARIRAFHEKQYPQALE